MCCFPSWPVGSRIILLCHTWGRTLGVMLVPQRSSQPRFTVPGSVQDNVVLPAVDQHFRLATGRKHRESTTHHVGVCSNLEAKRILTERNQKKYPDFSSVFPFKLIKSAHFPLMCFHGCCHLKMSTFVCLLIKIGRICRAALHN